jgi:hypothetical protein
MATKKIVDKGLALLGGKKAKKEPTVPTAGASILAALEERLALRGVTIKAERTHYVDFTLAVEKGDATKHLSIRVQGNLSASEAAEIEARVESELLADKGKTNG